MFRSILRPVVFAQADHARLAAALAAAWGNERFARPQLPFDSYLEGVAQHDRGYGELDTDSIGEVSSARWTEIQVDGFRPRGEDAVVRARTDRAGPRPTTPRPRVRPCPPWMRPCRA